MFDRRRFLALAASAASAFAAPQARANAPRPVNTLGSADKIAIRGYDPVAYFREGAPRQGKPVFASEHGGAVWRFASAENKALFDADPGRYLPAYGGFCAFGTSRGYLVKIEPEAWSIVDGKLYLNYDLGVRKDWAKNPKAYIAKADGNWPNLTAKDVR